MFDNLLKLEAELTSVVPTIPQHTIAAAANRQVPWDVPCIIFVGTNDPNGQIAGMIEAMITQFQRSPLYTNPRRAAEMVVGDDKLALLSTCPLPSEALELCKHLSPADVKFLDCLWIWAYSTSMCAAGPEWSSLGSVKHQTKGKRAVFCVECSALLDFAKTYHARGAGVTFASIIDLIAEADVAVLRALKAAKVPVCYSVVERGMVLHVPWGWLLCEKAVGTDIVAGIRWGSYSDTATPGFAELGAMNLPGNKASVKANSTLAFVSNLFQAFETLAENGQLPNASIKKLVPVKREAQASFISKPAKKQRLAA